MADVNGSYFASGGVFHAIGDPLDVDGETMPFVSTFHAIGDPLDVDGEIVIASDIYSVGTGSLVDTVPPAFLGITSAVAIDASSALLGWTAATDAVTDTDQIWYEIHFSESPGDPFVIRRAVKAEDVLPLGWAEIVGAPVLCEFTLDGLLPETLYYVRVRARDSGGNFDENTVERSFTTPADSAGAPVVTVIAPVPGSTITAATPFVFSVTDDSGAFRRVFVVAEYEGRGVVEVVHNGEAFVGHYASTSSRSIIALGWTYNVMRSGGWPSSPTFRVYAIDKRGNEGQ